MRLESSLRDGGEKSATRCDARAKVNPWSEEGGDGLVRDRIYIAQQDASDYQRSLANPKLQGIVRIRINNSGFITPISLTFRPRPARNASRDAVQ